MIDALELQVPTEIRPRLDFWKGRRRSRPEPASPYESLLHDEVECKAAPDSTPNEPEIQRILNGKPKNEADLPVGISVGPSRKDLVQDAIVYTGWGNRRLPQPKGHKLEFKRVRHLSADDIRRRILDYFEIGSEQVAGLKVVRVDFAVDIAAPVTWFRDHSEVKFKQRSEQFSGWNVEGVRRVLGLRFGTRSDLYRIYDKTAQLKDDGAPLLYPRMGLGAAPPETTRVERQCSGGRIPAPVSTLGALLSHALSWDPFQRLILHDADMAAGQEGWDAQKWLCCLGMRAALQEMGGVAALRKRLNALSGGKAKRYFDQYSDLLNTRPPITHRALVELYRRSTELQLFAVQALNLGKDARIWAL